MPNEFAKTEGLNEWLAILSANISKEVAAGMELVKDSKEERHRVANLAQTAVDKATTNGHRITTLEERMEALLGDGTGSNGRLAALSDTLRQTQLDMNEVKGDVKSIKDSISKMEPIAERSKDAMSGGRAIAWALGAFATIITVIGGVVGGVVWLYKH